MNLKPINHYLFRIGGILLLSFTLVHPHYKVSAQSTWGKVYALFQTSCTSASCHDNVSPKALMSLQGTGGNPMQDVYNNLFNQSPTNTYAINQNYKRILPGDPHRSFLFRKINNGLDADIVRHINEGGNMPDVGFLTDKDIELIRQWILYGAPQTGDVVDTALINSYYSGNGIASMPNPPAPPNADEGFQIHMGPYFIAPGNPIEELEYHLKYDPRLSGSIEINRVDIFMGNSSHHFILYRIYDETQEPDGLRFDGPAVDNREGVTAAQYSDSLFLPVGTAFIWPDSAILDLNSHYINSSPTSVLSCEVYINIYTQPVGFAKQIMKSTGILGALFELGVFPCVPNDSNTYTFETPYFFGSTPQSMENDIFIWSMNSHTHQLGTDFDIYKRKADGTRGVKYFDASHLYGHPDSTLVGYDYDRPPNLTFEPFLFVPKNEGLIQEASWVNTGPNNPVCWGVTSEDEMMIMGFFYVIDTTGLANAVPYVKPTGISEFNPEYSGSRLKFKAYPNPFSNEVTIELPGKNLAFVLYNVLGKEIKRIENTRSSKITMKRGDLSSGIYFYKILDDSNTSLYTGKLIIY